MTDIFFVWNLSISKTTPSKPRAIQVTEVAKTGGHGFESRYILQKKLEKTYTQIFFMTVNFFCIEFIYFLNYPIKTKGDSGY